MKTDFWQAVVERWIQIITPEQIAQDNERIRDIVDTMKNNKAKRRSLLDLGDDDEEDDDE